MKKGIIGKKLGMTQIFAENGAAIPVTVPVRASLYRRKHRLQTATVQYSSVMKTSGKSWLQNPAPDTSKKQTCPQSGT